MNAPAPTELKYDAFISYSRAVDGRLAPALRDSLQRFAKPWHRRRNLNVFLDKASIATNPALWPTIASSLAASKRLVLLASPESSQSNWVRKEVGRWREIATADRILIVLTSGHIKWDEDVGDFDWTRTDALPIDLSGAFTDEPTYLDMTWAKAEQHVNPADGRFRDAVADLASAILGRDKDELVGEDVRQHRKTKRLAWGASVGLAVLAMAATIAGVLAVIARNEAVTERDIAQSRELAVRSREALESDPTSAVELALAAVLKSETAEAADVLRLVLDQPELAAIEEPGRVTCLALTDDGLVVTGGDDGTVRLFDARHPDKPGRRIAQHEARGRGVAALAVTEEGLIVSGGDDGVVQVSDPDLPDGAGRVIARHEDQEFGVTVLAVTEDDLVVSGGGDGILKVSHPRYLDRDAQPIARHNGPVTALAVADTGTVVSGGRDDTWIVRSDPRHPDGHGRHIAQHGAQARRDTLGVTELALARDGRVVSGGADGIVRVSESRRLAGLGQQIARHEGPVTALAVADDGSVVSGGRDDAAVKLSNYRRPGGGGQRLAEHEASPSGITALIITEEGLVVSGGGEGTVKLSDSRHPDGAGQRISRHMTSDFGVSGLAVTEDGLVISGGPDGVRVSDPARTTHAADQIARHEGVVVALAMADHGLVVSGSSDGVVKVADPRRYGGTGRQIARHTVASSLGITTLASLENGLVISGGGDGVVRVADPKRPRDMGRRIGQHKTSGSGVTALLIRDDGLVVSGGDDGAVKVSDPDRPGGSGRTIAQHETSEATLRFGVTALALTDDGLAVSGGADGVVKVSDPGRTGVVARQIASHDGPISALGVTDDYVVSGASDGVVKVANISSAHRTQGVDGEVVARHEVPPESEGYGITALAITEAGTIVSGGGDGIVKASEYYHEEAVEWQIARHDNPDFGVGVTTLAVVNDDVVVSGGGGGVVKASDLRRPGGSGQQLARHGSATFAGVAVAVNEDGRVASGGDDGFVRVSDAYRPGGGRRADRSASGIGDRSSVLGCRTGCEWWGRWNRAGRAMPSMRSA